MRISCVVAMALDRVIGHEGGMPWHLPADLKHFRRVTLGKPVIMGRATHASIGRALPGRHNIVVTRNPDYAAEGCTLARDPQAALAAAGEVEEVMIIGGQRLFEYFLPRTDRLYLTLIEARLPGDTFFPEYSRADWEETAREAHDADAENPYPYTFLELARVTGSPQAAPG
jgi:dihydrofolate reductase